METLDQESIASLRAGVAFCAAVVTVFLLISSVAYCLLAVW